MHIVAVRLNGTGFVVCSLLKQFPVFMTRHIDRENVIVIMRKVTKLKKDGNKEVF